MTREVALKVIPKKKVKGNESSVWGEMEVLKGLDHPNIVSPIFFTLCFFRIACIQDGVVGVPSSAVAWRRLPSR